MIRLLKNNFRYLFFCLVLCCCKNKNLSQTEYFEGGFKEQRIILIINKDSLFFFNDHTQTVIGHYAKSKLPNLIELKDSVSKIKIQNEYVHLERNFKMTEKEIQNKLLECNAILNLKSKLLGEWQITQNNLKRGILYNLNGEIKISNEYLSIKNDNRKVGYFLSLPNTLQLSFNDYVQNLKINFESSQDSLLFIAKNELGNKIIFSDDW